MSAELLAAVGELTEAVENKVTTMARDARAATAELESIKHFLARGAALESKPEREYHEAWREWVRTKDSRALQRAEHKTVLAGAAPGALAIPKALDAAIVFAAKASCPWLAPEILGVKVAAADYRVAYNDGSGAAISVSETGTRSLGETGVFREIAPSWAEYGGHFQASEHAKQDIENFEAQMALHVGDQIADALAADIISGAGGGDAVMGLLATAPTSSADFSSPLRAHPSLQYVSTSSSPMTALRFADVATLLGEFHAKYLSDDSFAILMNPRTFWGMVAAESGAGALTMGSPPRIFGYRVALCEKVAEASADAHVILAGAWKRAYALVSRSEVPAMLVDTNFTSIGFTKWHISRRIGGAVADFNAAKVLKCG